MLVIVNLNADFRIAEDWPKRYGRQIACFDPRCSQNVGSIRPIRPANAHARGRRSQLVSSRKCCAIDDLQSLQSC